MTYAQYRKNLDVPTEPVDVILNTDVSNEIDDQFAIGYLLRCGERLRPVGLCSAPFTTREIPDPAQGADKTWAALQQVVTVAGREELLERCYPGSRAYLPDEKTPVESPAARFMVETARRYSPEKPLYLVGIGVLTDIASALLMEPAIAENVVIVWLGGHAQHLPRTDEFNMAQDIAAARVVFDSPAPLVQLPCFGVVEQFVTTRYELEHWLRGKGALADYLCQLTVDEYRNEAVERPWSRSLWDVTAVAWLMNDGNRFMTADIRPAPVVEYDFRYAYDSTRKPMRYITAIRRDALFDDMFRRLAE